MRRLPNLVLPRCALVLLALLALPCRQAAFAETSATAGLADQSDSDRLARLIAGAKKEGAVTVYSSATVEDLSAIGAAFERKYGVKVRLWRASSESIVQRAVTEARGGRSDADVLETGALAMESMHRERLLLEVKTSALAGLLPAAIPPHREWIGTRFNVYVAAYNTGLVGKDELPRSYDDLLDRRWRAKLGVEADDSDWFGGIIGALGEERGLKLFREIVAANGVSVRKGHTLLANLVVSGEVPFALTTYAFRAEQLRKSGAPLAWIVIPPVVARFEGAAIARRAAHPNGGALFFEFMLTDAQDILRARDFFPASRETKALPSGVSVTFLDPAKALDEDRKWSKLYRDIISNPAR
jgi:iron(III) transport system substrate-binding protein